MSSRLMCVKLRGRAGYRDFTKGCVVMFLSLTLWSWWGGRSGLRKLGWEDGTLFWRDIPTVACFAQDAGMHLSPGFLDHPVISLPDILSPQRRCVSKNYVRLPRPGLRKRCGEGCGVCSVGGGSLHKGSLRERRLEWQRRKRNGVKHGRHLTHLPFLCPQGLQPVSLSKTTEIYVVDGKPF